MNVRFENYSCLSGTFINIIMGLFAGTTEALQHSNTTTIVQYY